MPRLPIDYSKIVIYKLVHKEDYDNANIYIGSTTDFVKRKTRHKCDCNNEKSKRYNQKNYQYIHANGGWDEWNMIEVEKYPCNDGNEARAREEYWKCYFNANLNSKKAFRTEEQKKDYYYDNKDKLQEKYKEKTICKCGCIILKCCLNRHYKSKKHTDFILLNNQIN